MFGKRRREMEQIMRDIADTQRRIEEKRGAAAGAATRVTDSITEKSLQRIEEN